jgi:hypothetical protein
MDVLMEGIRILDNENKAVSVELSDILEEIPNGDGFCWSILCLEGKGHLHNNQSLLALENQINDSKDGFSISWIDLNMLCKKLYEIIDITILGCKNKSFLHRYEHDREMCEACDIVIDMIDSSYWEVFSKDEHLIGRLASKFKHIQFLKASLRRDLI